jgi:hypothetical protein
MNSVLQINYLDGQGSNISTKTITGSFLSNTHLHSLLLCEVQVEVDETQVGSYPPAAFVTGFSVTTPGGFVWQQISAEICPLVFQSHPGNYNSDTVAVALFAIPSAAVMSSSAVISINVTASGLAHINLFAQLQEVSGPTSLRAVITPAYGSGNTAPSVGNITGHAGDFLITAEADSGANLTGFGSQWTLGVSDGVQYTGYVANATAQTYTPAFVTNGPGGSCVWACVAAAFESIPPTPTITSVSPNNGPSGGGQSVTITGTNFNSDAAVYFGSNAATSVVVVSPTEITCVTPVHFPGTVNVEVTEAAGSVTATNAYTYTASMIPLTMNFQDAGGHPLSYGTVTFTLNTDAVTITGQQINAGRVVSFTLDVNGNLSGFIWPNDQLTADGLSPNTTYRIKAYTDNGQLCFEQDLVIAT